MADVAVPGAYPSGFARALEADRRITLFVKLPADSTVPTPLGDYNPDWAIVAAEPASLRPEEQQKIVCGKAHFEGALEHVRFRGPVTAPSDLWS